jgi:hypothetical protein
VNASKPVRGADEATSAQALQRVLPLQLVRAGIILCIAALAYCGLGFTSGGDGTVLGLVLGVLLLALFTVLAAALIGVPLRLIGPVRRWWGKHTALMPAITGIGKLLILTSLATGSTELLTDQELPGSLPFAAYQPNMPLLGIGWITFAFGAAHLWSPRAPKQPPTKPRTCEKHPRQ